MTRTRLLVTLMLGIAALPSSALADMDFTLEELPAAVRETVKREVRGGTIVDIERDKGRSATVYEVEFIEQGKKYELDIAEDGTLLRRHRD